MEKTVEIEYGGKKEQVELRRITARERNDAIRKSTTVVKEDILKGIREDVIIDPVTLKEYIVLTSIAKAPFSLTIDALLGLYPEQFDAIAQASLELNNVSEKKN